MQQELGHEVDMTAVKSALKKHLAACFAYQYA
jgi:hypothetical protein